MNPALHIALKDLRETVLDGRALIAWVLAVLVLLAGVMQAAGQWRAAASERQAVEAQVRAQWDGQGEKNPHRGAHFGLYAFKPDALPALVDPGSGPEAGRAIWLDPHRRNLSRFKPAEDQSVAARLAPASVAAVLQWVLPLLVVALGFAAVAAEREAGTWRLLTSLGVVPHRLLLGKLAVLALVAVPMLLVFAAAAMYVLVRGEGDALARIIGMALLYTVYLGVFAFLVLGISARAASASQALALSLVLWGVNGMVAPRVADAVAGHAVELPTTEQFHAAIAHDIEHGLDGDGNVRERSERFLAQTLAKYGVSQAQDLPVALRGLRLLNNDAYASRVYDKHHSELAGRFVAQSHWQLAASLLGPLPAVRALSQSLAGTDVQHHLHFSDAAEAYRRSFIDATSEEIVRRNRGTDNSATLGNAYWRTVPPLDYRGPGWIWALASQWRALLVLAAWLLASGAFAMAGFRRLAREA